MSLKSLVCPGQLLVFALPVTLAGLVMPYRGFFVVVAENTDIWHSPQTAGMFNQCVHT